MKDKTQVCVGKVLDKLERKHKRKFKQIFDKFYHLSDEYDYTNKINAYKKSQKWDDAIPIGIFYKEDKPTYIDNITYLKKGSPPR